jgi:glycosyltransferase involved in cell wall biosynthesis
MRVLFALPGLHRVTRGAEVAFEELAGRIAVRPGYDVTVIGSGSPRADRPYRYARAACIPREYFERLPSVPYLRSHYAWEELTFLPGLCRAYHPADYDLTVTCGYPYTNWLLRARRHDGQRPLHVFVTQNGDWMCQSRDREFRHFFCDGLVCTNQEYFGRNRERWNCALIPNGVDPQRFSPGPAERTAFGLPEDATVVLMVSALIPSKRIFEGISAAAQLHDVHLVVAGDGELREQVKRLGHRLMPGRFQHLILSRERMPDLYRCADVYLHMSQDEPSANAYIEALATGLPIVTHDRDVTRWTLEDQAVLVDTGESNAVACGIRHALGRKTPHHQAARRALVERRFSWDALADQYACFFERLAGVQR